MNLGHDIEQVVAKHLKDTTAAVRALYEATSCKFEDKAALENLRTRAYIAASVLEDFTGVSAREPQKVRPERQRVRFDHEQYAERAHDILMEAGIPDSYVCNAGYMVVEQVGYDGEKGSCGAVHMTMYVPQEELIRKEDGSRPGSYWAACGNKRKPYQAIRETEAELLRLREDVAKSLRVIESQGREMKALENQRNALLDRIDALENKVNA